MKKPINLHVDEKMHQEIKIYCVENNISMTQYIIKLIEKDIKK
jgi:predicted HicB family RNase H-like nuclease